MKHIITHIYSTPYKKLTLAIQAILLSSSMITLSAYAQDDVATTHQILETIEVTATENISENTQSYTVHNTNSATKLNLSPKDTPISFDVTRFEAKDAKGNKVNTNNSRTSANIFAKYSWDKFSIGGGVNYRSKFYTGIGENRIDQNAIVLANLMANYQFTPEFSTQLNIENLFDKTYYEGIGSNAMNYGSPRYANLTFKYKF